MVKNMKCSIRGEKIRVTKAIDQYINAKLSRIDKYFKDESIEAKVLIKLKGKKQAIEVTIPYDKYTLRSESEHDDLYAAIDLVVDKLEGQIRKNKARAKKQIKKDNTLINFEYEITKEEEKAFKGKKVIKRKTIEMKPMDEEEAMLEIELLGHDFFIYRDVHTNHIHILYKRKDGNYGVIETGE